MKNIVWLDLDATVLHWKKREKKKPRKRGFILYEEKKNSDFLN